ncbi:MAG: hypothetical protein IKD72_01345 [Clostridia bacterium]|nr:hypothetical protein [Clostridia bacterium]
MPPVTKFEYKVDMTFFGPSFRVGLQQHVPLDNREIKMERADIYDHLIGHALAQGVKIEYGCRIEAPILFGNRVVGVKTSAGDFYGDLVIDACGVDSPLRLQLPDSLGIEKDPGEMGKIYIYRAFYNKGKGAPAEAKYKVMLFADGKQGISWVADEEDYTDVLVGRFEPFDEAEALRFTEVLRETNPRIGRERLRGGQFAQIPVRQPLSILVADGYAAIGDSAFMTVPLIGSGMANCFKAARILAETVINDAECAFNSSTLWPYQVGYYKLLGAGFATLAAAKATVADLTPDEIDYIFESGMVTEDDITMGADFTNLFAAVKLDPKELIVKAKGAISDPKLLKKFAVAAMRMGKASAACSVMPKKWNRDRVLAWSKMYQLAFK